MHALMDSLGYNRWILPALLALPLAGTLVLALQSRRAGSTPEARMASARRTALFF